MLKLTISSNCSSLCTLKISTLNVQFINYSCKGRYPFITNCPFVSFLTPALIFLSMSGLTLFPWGNNPFYFPSYPVFPYTWSQVYLLFIASSLCWNYFNIWLWRTGMSDLCSPMIILLDDEADAFWCFERMMKRLVHNFTRTACL